MFDRTTWIAIAISVAGLVGYNFYYQKTYGPYLAQQAAEQKAARLNAESTAETHTRPLATPLPITSLNTASEAQPPIASGLTTGAAPAAGATPVIPDLSPRRETQDTSRAEYLFANNTGGIEGVTLFLHLGANLQSLYLNKDSGLPIGALCDSNALPIGGFTMTTDKKKLLTQFTLTTTNGLSITKSFTLPDTKGSPEEYLVALDLSFQNSGSTPISLPNYSIAAGGEGPVHINDLPTYTCFDWYKDDKMTSINVSWFEAGKIPLIGIELHPAKEFYTQANDGVQWAAVTSQYFTTIITAAKDQAGTGVWSRRYVITPAGGSSATSGSSTGNPVYGITGGLGIGPILIAPGQTVTRHYSLYIGPKDFYSLKKMGDEQQNIMNFGMFHLVSELLLWAMNHLKPVVGSYAAAIIVLTLIIKSVLWPLQNKATSSMKRMQLLNPKMTELREKYKDDPTKMNEELMKLYKQYGVNPLGGCLPMLVQIPIFFGFYSMLGSAIELRNSHFLWITDLSQPDTITHFMGFPINLLPIIMAGTMLWQMAISPKSGDAVQQRVMYFMPVIFLSFAYNYASGLALYWTTQNLFSIAQLYYTRNQPLPTLEKIAKPKPSGGKGSGNNRNR
jgi:YidC/Oxa1 family membrane protein insertase